MKYYLIVLFRMLKLYYRIVLCYYLLLWFLQICAWASIYCFPILDSFQCLRYFGGILTLKIQLGSHERKLTEEELETHSISAWKEGKLHLNRQIDGSGRLYPRRLIHVSAVGFWFYLKFLVHRDVLVPFAYLFICQALILLLWIIMKNWEMFTWMVSQPHWYGIYGNSTLFFVLLNC